MNRVENVSRRSLLKGFAGMGGLVLGMQITPESLLSATAKSGSHASSRFKPNIWLALQKNGDLTIVTHRSEMGTGCRTSLPMIVADEMEADWKRVAIEQAIGDEKYGSQNTDGSRSVRNFYQTMRVAGASARQMLEAAAAKRWGVSTEECTAKNHFIVHESGKKLGFGELAEIAADLPIPPQEKLTFKEKKDWRYVGTAMPMTDLEDIVTGKAKFGLDVELEGMKYASIERCPVVGGKVISFDPTDALAVTGVDEVVEIPAAKPPFRYQALGGVAVIGSSTWAVLQGREKLRIKWDRGENVIYNSDTYRTQLEATAGKPGVVVREEGDVDKVFASNAKTHEAAYYTPHLAHAAMEPLAATAQAKEDTCELWAPTQNPQAARDEAANALGLDKKKVICNVTLLGGGFGRKSKPDYCAEAAILSRKLGNLPVRVVWTREDDMRHGYYHACAALNLKAAVDENGSPTAWRQRTVFPTIGWIFGDTSNRGSAGELGQGFSDLAFSVPNLRVEVGKTKTHVRVGWLRSVANIYHAFAVHSFADELAHLAGRDPLEYMLELIGKERHVDMSKVEYPNYDQPLEIYPVDTGRLAKTLTLAATKIGWGRKLPKGRGLGLAVHRSFLTYVASAVEVEVTKAGKLTIPRIEMAVDCGLYVNRDRVISQMEGAAVFGTGLAMMGEITAREGAIVEGNFMDHLIPRINEAPIQTNVHIIENSAPPAGVGEPGVPPVPPALTNAIFAATGKRVRELPLSKVDLGWS